MKNIHKKLAALIAAGILTAATVTPAAYAIEPSYKVGSAYSQSKFYNRLLAVTLTGDQRYDVIAVAISQLGYHEGNSTSEMHGMNSSGSGNFTEYNRIIGTVGGSYGFEWCAAFVSWCLRQARVPTSLAVTEASCSRMMDWLSENGSYKKRSSGYTPKPGDIIFFRASTSVYYSSHVGLVAGYKNGYVYTIEGNNGGEVNYHKYEASSAYIMGYGAPNYTQKAGTVYDFELRDTYFERGIYTVDEDLNLRTGPSTAYKSQGKIPRGTALAVSDGENGWAQVVYNGKNGYVSMDYLTWQRELEYTLSFNSTGGDNAPESIVKSHGSPVTVSQKTPNREGYTFLGWSSSEGGEVQYLPGDSYRADTSITLYAVWEIKKYTVTFYGENGFELYRAEVHHGGTILAPAAPKKADTVLYSYEFSGWSPNVPDAVTEALELYPT